MYTHMYIYIYYIFIYIYILYYILYIVYYIHIFCTCVELAGSKQCVVGIILPKWPCHFGSSIGASYHKHLKCFRFALSRSFAMAPKSLAPASSASAAAADTMEVDYGSDGSFELMDETFGEDLAERVAEVAKCKSDTVSVALAGTPPFGLRGLQKSLAALTAEMSRLQTKDTLPDLGPVPSAGPAIGGQVPRYSWPSRKLRETSMAWRSTGCSMRRSWRLPTSSSGTLLSSTHWRRDRRPPPTFVHPARHLACNPRRRAPIWAAN